jgi:hypothetical protein
LAIKKPPYSILSLLLLFLLSALPAAWSQAGITFDVTLGWNGVLRADRYVPLIVSIGNAGKKTSCVVSVDLVSGSMSRGNAFTRTFAQSASLGSRSRKRFFFCVPVPSSFRPIVVRVEAGGVEVARRQIDMLDTISVDRLVVAVSSDLSLDFLSEIQPGLRVVYPHVENLPESWAGYDGVEAVFVHDTAFQNFRASQVAALRQWVFSGGTLIFSGGLAALQLESSGLDGLLPVKVTGLAVKKRLPSLAGLPGAPAVPRGDIILAVSRLTAGKALLEEDGIPIVVSRPLGLGRVRFLAFDCTVPPLSGWQGKGALWRFVSGGSNPPLSPGGGQGPIDDAWLKVPLDSPSHSFPSGYTLAAFLAAYIILVVPLASRRVAGKAKPRTRAVLLCVCAVAASVTGWLLFDRLLFHGEVLIDASMAQGVSADGLARVTQKVGLYSAAGGEFELSVPSPSALIEENDASREKLYTRGFTAEISDGTLVKNIRLPGFGARLFSFNAVVNLGVRASLSEDVSGSRVLEVENGSSRVLKDAFLFLDGASYSVGDVPEGGRLKRVMDTAKGAAREKGGKAGVIKADPERLAFWNLVKAGLPRENPLFIAWLDESLLPVKAVRNSSAVSGESLHMLSVEAQ